MSQILRKRLDLAFQSSNEGVWQWDCTSGEVYYSKKILEFFNCQTGLEPNIFKHPEYCFYDSDVALFNEELQLVLKNEGHQTMAVDVRFVKGDGVLCWLRIRGVSVRNSTGELERLVGSMIDVSKRKNIELNLEEERHLLKLLINSIPNNVYFKDRESRFVMVNQATVDRLGHGKEDHIVGKTDLDFFEKSLAEEFIKGEQEIMASLEPQVEKLVHEYWVQSEETAWSLSSKVPWFGSNGEVKGTVGITNDVSELVNSQVNLMNVAEELREKNDMYKEELQLAHEIQKSLLQKEFLKFPNENVNSSREVQFLSHNQSTGEIARGFYELIPIDDHRIGVFICDVIESGVRSALVVSIMRGLIEQVRKKAKSTSVFMERLNSSIFSIFESANISVLVRAFYLTVDFSEESVRFSSAGYPSPLVYKEEELTVLDSELKAGPTLGLVEKSGYRSDTARLRDVDKLVLYTNGLFGSEANKLDLICMGVNRIGNKQKSLESTLKDLVDVALSCSKNQKFEEDVYVLGMSFTKRES